MVLTQTLTNIPPPQFCIYIKEGTFLSHLALPEFFPLLDSQLICVEEFSRSCYLLCSSRQKQFGNSDMINSRMVCLSVSAASKQNHLEEPAWDFPYFHLTLFLQQNMFHRLTNFLFTQHF